jgi:L-ascorbate 6-phosphate lactonase
MDMPAAVGIFGCGKETLKMLGDRHDVVPAMEAYPMESGLRLWWFGGPSYAIRSPESIVYIDPFHSGERADDPGGFIRAIPNVLFPEDVSRADLILSTHDHLDHCDPDTLRPMCARTDARLVAAPSSSNLMAQWDFTTGRVDTMPPGATKTYGDMALTAYPSRDWSDPGAVTYVLHAQGRGVFIGGDTLYFDGLQDIGGAEQIDLAILALARNRRDIIDKELYVDPGELARAARALKTRRVLPVHWDIWKAWREDPALVAPYLEKSGIELVIPTQSESLAI